MRAGAFSGTPYATRQSPIIAVALRDAKLRTRPRRGANRKETKKKQKQVEISGLSKSDQTATEHQLSWPPPPRRHGRDALPLPGGTRRCRRTGRAAVSGGWRPVGPVVAGFFRPLLVHTGTSDSNTASRAVRIGS
ncbi:LOW QUALITY PROTEIN: hypothetical protein GQ55_3G248300 [Panicum hallii var. hallii]|uniref:Uncharacterized protein n=1 Tax=Panicum hallii var. hallii TaxID=1504633 RepID=A0A2T7ED32_9POAL|nr:LOW QUALITY PROTEIN: hypothetical protein GQ55_3G248300 [Panicum hallii var. hallii]